MVTKQFCRVCKNELVKTDVTSICDGCLFSLNEREYYGNPNWAGDD